MSWGATGFGQGDVRTRFPAPATWKGAPVARVGGQATSRGDRRRIKRFAEGREELLAVWTQFQRWKYVVARRPSPRCSRRSKMAARGPCRGGQKWRRTTVPFSGGGENGALLRNSWDALAQLVTQVPGQ
jgi:hypothetical protein